MVRRRQRGDPGRLGGDERRYRGNPPRPAHELSTPFFFGGLYGGAFANSAAAAATVI